MLRYILDADTKDMLDQIVFRLRQIEGVCRVTSDACEATGSIPDDYTFTNHLLAICLADVEENMAKLLESCVPCNYREELSA